MAVQLTPKPGDAGAPSGAPGYATLGFRLNMLVNILPRRPIPTSLRPLEGVTPSYADGYSYRATTQQPAFLLDVNQPTPAGWYYFETEITRGSGSRLAWLELDVGAGFAAGPQLMIPSNFRGVVREVVRFPAGVTALRWAPNDAVGEFRQHPVVIHRITAVESALRRAGRVVFDVWRSRNLPVSGRLNLSLSVVLFRLTEAYSLSGAFRRRRMEAFANQALSQHPPIQQEAGPPRLLLEIEKPDHTVLAATEIVNPARQPITIIGWAMARAGVARVEVLLDGSFLGDAQHGMRRDDLKDQHPDWDDALHSGFTFTIPTSSVKRGLRRCTVSLTDSAGQREQKTFVIRQLGSRWPWLSAATAADRDDARDSAPDEPCKMHLDEPSLKDGEVQGVVGSQLSIVGWALARAGVKSVEIQMDGRPIGDAFMGIRRDSVQEAYPDWPASVNSGFAFFAPLRSMATGRRTFSVVLTDSAGRTLRKDFTFQKAATDDDGKTSTLRGRVGEGEALVRNKLLAAGGWRPSFAVVIICDENDLEYRLLEQTMLSVEAQSYQDFAIFIASGGQDVPARARSHLRERGLTRRTAHWFDDDVYQDCRAVCDGGTSDYLIALRAGDTLSVVALHEFALATGVHRDADFFYADEVRARDAQDQAFLKPDWSPDLLNSTNYIGRPWAASAALVQRSGVTVRSICGLGFFDSVLRFTEVASRIAHVVGVLGRSSDAPEAVATEIAALRRSLERRGVKATVTASPTPGLFEVRRPLTRPAMVSIIIPSIGARDLVERCFESIRQFSVEVDYEIICIDNIPRRDDPRKTWFRNNADIVVENPTPFNWALLNNAGAAKARGDILLFLNDDVEIREAGWLTGLVSIAQRSEIGAVGARLMYPGDHVQHSGMFLAGPGVARHAFRFLDDDAPGYFGLAHCQRNVTAVTGACLMVRRDVFDQVGGFDEAHAVINNDLDFCLRVRAAGYLNVVTPYVRLTHHELASRAGLAEVYDEAGFHARWNQTFAAGDPYFHPYLSRHSDDYQAEQEATQIVFPSYPVFEAASIERILVVKLDHIGDFIISVPALRRLRQVFPSAEITALVGPGGAAIARSLPEVDRIEILEFFNTRSELEPPQLDAEDLQVLSRRLSPYRFDLALDLRKHPETRHLLQWSGAPLTAGFDHGGRFAWLDVALEAHPDQALAPKRRHMMQELIRLVDAVAEGCAPLPAGFEIEPASIDQLIAWGVLPAAYTTVWPRGPLVCVHPAVGNAARQWPPVHFATLIDLLVARNGATVILVGGPDERDVEQAVLTQVTHLGSVFSAVGRVSLSDLPRLIAACDLFVGNNSGPHHWAAATGTPTIGIHSGVVDAAEWGPIGDRAVAIRRNMVCSPCYLSRPAQCHRALACLTELTPGDVYRLCQQWLVGWFSADRGTD